MVKAAFSASSCYGIDMASVCGWPQGTVDKGYTIRDFIVDKIGGDGGVKLDTGAIKGEETDRKALSEIAKSLVLLPSELDGKGGLSEDAVREWLAGLSRGISDDEEDEKEGGGGYCRLGCLTKFLVA